jgi:hypothetical protein
MRDFDDAAVSTWPAAARALSPAVVHAMLPRVQRQFTRVVADRNGATFLAQLDVATEAGQANAARVRSMACRPASAWLDALPTSPPLVLGDGDYIVCAHFRLGGRRWLRAASWRRALVVSGA